MKKNVLFVAMAVFALATVSCGKKADTASTPTIEVEEVEVATTDGDDLAQYEAFVDKYIDILAKVQKGDTAAAQELSTLASDNQELLLKLASEASSWSQEKAEKYQAISKKYTDAVSNMAK